MRIPHPVASRFAAAFLMGASLSIPAYAEEINVAIVGEPDTFDPMMSTKDVVSIVTQHLVETLFTFDDTWAVAPLLAKDLPEISDGGKTYKIALREGITFHDGSAMDSADVVASLKRWLEVATRGKGVADKIDDVVATGPYEIEIRMNEAYSPLLSLLAFSNSAAAIYPEEILGETIDQVVGTGPYRLIEHVPDQYIQLGRFDGYVSREEASDGAAGARQQIADEIRFLPVPDPNTRVEGLLSGQYDFADSLPAESYARLETAEGAEPMLLKPFGWPIFAINHKAGLLTDLEIRKALQAALPIDDMLFAAFGDDNFFVVDGPLYPEGWAWRNDAGIENYNQNDQAKAADLLKQAGYDGTPLRILTSRQYEFHFKMAEVAKVALEAAGFKVQMDVVDWATLGQRRNDPALWDIYITHSPFLPEPALTSMYAPTSRLGWANEEKDAILTAFTTETDTAKRQELFSQLQGQVFEDVGFIKIGGFNALMGHKSGLTGVTPSPWPFFWNAKTN
ncbi:ABC transporter substrate-binding protein [Roseibium marinum]|uniref:Peptide/nickel transport system substrate-binding protein n=1 Tax=Roseibium marinum TaxID=281252 RepID=A0A2S3V271_9HYPH|nr:ABC transporter substrate-binding protein [Roseibium marinum]POF34077.1 peptide/nickel transport system substrate-binding protein [Roseibium marinum]